MSELTPYQTAQRDYFNGYYKEEATTVDFEHYDRPRFGPWNPYSFQHEQILALLSKPQQKLLVIGSGAGADALRYAQHGFDVTGIDISAAAVKVAQAAADRYDLADRARFSEQPAESMPFPDASFDVVVSVNVLHHTETQRSIPEVRRVIKKGGVAIFKEPLATPFRDRMRNSRLVTWLLPKGIKNKKTGTRYADVPEEHMIDKTDFRLLRELFTELRIKRFRVLAALSILFGRKSSLERWDYRMFRVLPFMRRFGDQAVLTATA